METLPDISPLWDISQASSFSQLADDDFLALLQKQFPTSNGISTYNPGGFNNGVNPQNISRYSLPSITPPSEDSSPSPPNMNNDSSSRSPSNGDNDDIGDPALKRKASDEDFEEGPSQKNQHTSPNNKKGPSSSRRKSTGGGGPDENRLLKRKEQNRAAQRAFRERKEKHVKDLEDKVAALEAKNEQAVSENENLRDLLSRLQTENIMLKSSSFTFSVPKTAGSSSDAGGASSSFAQSPTESPLHLFGSAPRSTSVVSTPASSRASPKPTLTSSTLDWSSLTSFDPSMLNLLDDSTQTTATDGAMQMEYGFGENTGLSSNAPYTTIASNPAFMSFASAFDGASPVATGSDTGTFNFDMNSLSSWPSPPPPPQDSGTLDDLFGGYMGPQGPVDFNVLMASPPSAISPISHHNSAIGRSPANSTSSSSPSSNGSDQSMFNTPRDSSASESEHAHDETECPKTKAALAKSIQSQGESPFAPPATSPSIVRKGTDSVLGPMIMCQGSSFPKTEKSEKNVEVLSAWRTITSNPRFKDADINELCTEFTNKARCDGTKVVLEPQGVHHILQTLSSKQ